MRKIVYLILLLSLVWLGKLSYDVAQYSQALPQLQQQLAQTEQRYALLNDQFVAVQRQLQQGNEATTTLPEHTAPVAVVTGVAPRLVIQQQLQLVQFALEQQQFIYALDHLNQVQQHMNEYSIAPALKHSLIQAIQQDKQTIQQFVLTQNQQQQQLDALLQQLDQSLRREIRNPQVDVTSNEKQVWWHWFTLERVQRNTPDLMNRHIALKEIQLHLLLASQALHQGQIESYRDTLQQVQQLLAELPDQQSQQINNSLKKVINLPVITPPKLTALALLG